MENKHNINHWEKIRIQRQTEELGKLLSMIESSVESEVLKRYEIAEEFQNTPCDADSGVDILGELEIKLDEFNTAATYYRLWAYGGYIVTVLSWLSDRLLWLNDVTVHPTTIIFWERNDDYMQPIREPYIRTLINKLLPDNTILSEKILTWNDLRNRFVHSLGIVVGQPERDRFSTILKVTFDSEGRMDLTADICRDVLMDVENCVIEATSNKGEI